MNLLRRHAKLIFTKRILCYQFGGITRVCFFLDSSKEPTINPDIYCVQLMKSDKEIKEKRLELSNRKKDSVPPR